MLSSLPVLLAVAAPAKTAPAAQESSTALPWLLGFVALTLVITWFSARKSSGASAYFAAGRRLTGLQNGLAVAGAHLSAASFLGLAGLIAFYGYDGFLYSIGWFVGFLTVLLIVAEPLRNAGKYTIADLLTSRLKPRPVRAMAALNAIAVCLFLLVAELVGAGLLAKLLLPTVPVNWAIAGIGALTIVYVSFGGMRATSWVQISKAILLLSGALLLSFLVMNYYHFSFTRFFRAISEVLIIDPKTRAVSTQNFLLPGLKFGAAVTHGWGPLEQVSLGLALLFGTAGLPHIVGRFYTVPDAKTARASVVWAMVVIGLFYLATSLIGFGAAAILTPGKISSENMAALLLATKLGSAGFSAFLSAVVFATVLAMVAGLLISASTSFAHDFFANVIHHGQERPEGEAVFIARITAVVIGALAIFLAINFQKSNVAFLVGLAFAVAASAHLPVFVLALFWRRFNTAGAVAGLAVGLLGSIVLIILSPSIMGLDAGSVPAAQRHLLQRVAIFPLTNPGIVSIPLGFLAAILATLFTKKTGTERQYQELLVRAHTGLGAEQATAHSGSPPSAHQTARPSVRSCADR